MGQGWLISWLQRLLNFLGVCHSSRIAERTYFIATSESNRDSFPHLRMTSPGTFWFFFPSLILFFFFFYWQNLSKGLREKETNECKIQKFSLGCEWTQTKSIILIKWVNSYLMDWLFRESIFQLLLTQSDFGLRSLAKTRINIHLQLGMVCKTVESRAIINQRLFYLNTYIW